MSHQNKWYLGLNQGQQMVYNSVWSVLKDLGWFEHFIEPLLYWIWKNLKGGHTKFQQPCTYLHTLVDILYLSKFPTKSLGYFRFSLGVGPLVLIPAKLENFFQPPTYLFGAKSITLFLLWGVVLGPNNLKESGISVVLWLGGHSIITWTRFWSYLTPSPPYMDNFT